MKMPNNQSSEKLYEYDEPPYYPEAVDNNGVEEFHNFADDDFSEYLWMENEEEFDKEVLQRLEEEALMEQCIEAMLADECIIEAANAGGPEFANDMANMLNNLKLDCDLVKRSNLNPLAEEFVPSARVITDEITNESH